MNRETNDSFRVLCLLETADFLSICSRIHFTRLMQSDLVFPGMASAIFFHRSFLSIDAG